jgi:hypothetical protein
VITAPATATSYTATYAPQPTCFDAYGYICTTAYRPFVSADSKVLRLRGDNAIRQVTLPFPFRLYSQIYTSVSVDTNGKLTFGRTGRSYGANTAIPSVASPNSSVYAFWDDLVVDSRASVRTRVIGAAPNRMFVVEWRNVYLRGNRSHRISVEALLYENGNIATNYKSLNNTAEKGKSATVGIENATGRVAIRYSFNAAVLSDGLAVLYRAPGAPAP